jgi:hypothetical protein
VVELATFKTSDYEGYVITGKDRSGKRFKPIYTSTPQHYNIWEGTLWYQNKGKRAKIKEYWN